MPLLEALADIVSLLVEDERAAVERISVPVVQVNKGPLALASLLTSRAAFAAVVLDGVVFHRLSVGGEPGLRIIGAGDVISPPEGSGPSLLSSSRYVAQSSVRLALLGSDYLAATRRAPRITLGLVAVRTEQFERLFAQLAICQLPRVADRVLAMLWLLADSFGRVTPAGTRLPLPLTHEVLGALVGARRPTVTIALGELSKGGAVVPEDGGWLLLKPPPAVEGGHRTGLEGVRLLDQGGPGWAAAPEPAPVGLQPDLR